MLSRSAVTSESCLCLFELCSTSRESKATGAVGWRALFFIRRHISCIVTSSFSGALSGDEDDALDCRRRGFRCEYVVDGGLCGCFVAILERQRRKRGTPTKHCARRRHVERDDHVTELHQPPSSEGGASWMQPTDRPTLFLPPSTSSQPSLALSILFSFIGCWSLVSVYLYCLSRRPSWSWLAKHQLLHCRLPLVQTPRTSFRALLQQKASSDRARPMPPICPPL